jgi:hypothetical protein
MPLPMRRWRSMQTHRRVTVMLALPVAVTAARTSALPALTSAARGSSTANTARRRRRPPART